MIIVAGCSAAGGWPLHLTGHGVIGTAKAFASQRMIAYFLIDALKDNLDRVTRVFCQLTEPIRRDAIVTDALMDRIGLDASENVTFAHDAQEPYWLMTAPIGDWQRQPDHFWLDTFNTVLLVQTYCRLHGVPVTFLFRGGEYAAYAALTAQETRWSRPVHDLIDWSDFWFHGEHGGMLQWMVDHDLFDLKLTPGGNPIGHPSVEANRRFAEEVIMPMIS